MKHFIYTLCLIGCIGNLGSLKAQDPDSVQVPQSDTLEVVADTLYEEEEGFNEENDTEDAYRDSTTIQWGNKSRIIITEDQEGNRVIKLVKKKDSENIIIEEEDDDDDWDDDDWDDDDWDDDDDKWKYRRRNYSTVDFLAFDLGVTNYYNDETFGVDAAVPDLEVRSFRPASHVALHFFPTTVSLFGRGVVNLKTAVTIDWTQFYFTEDIQLQPDLDTVTWTFPGVNYDKNKLTTRYAQIPLLLNFNTDPRHNEGLSLSIGGYAGVLWGARTKQVSDAEGKNKVRDDFNVNSFRYGLTARVDLRWLDFYFNLNMSQLFEEDEDRGINTQTFTAGINIIDF
ncbi:MAG: outer membrane beta-barrel protein [Bacteroidota bacterium]